MKALVRAVRHNERRGRRDPRERTKAGFTQEGFASEVGIDRSYYGAIERGEHNVTIETLALIAAGLRTSAWKLLRQAGV